MDYLRAYEPADDSMNCGRTIGLPCGHIFHDSCLAPDYNQHKCPNCRRVNDNKYLFYVYVSLDAAFGQESDFSQVDLKDMKIVAKVFVADIQIRHGRERWLKEGNRLMTEAHCKDLISRSKNGIPTCQVCHRPDWQMQDPLQTCLSCSDVIHANCTTFIASTALIQQNGIHCPWCVQALPILEARFRAKKQKEL